MREKIPLVVFGPDGRPLNGATVTITDRDTAAPATIYQGETGGATFSNPVLSADGGLVPGWLDRGGYSAVIAHGSGVMHPGPVNFPIGPARDGHIDSQWLPASTRNAIGLAEPGETGGRRRRRAIVSATPVNLAVGSGAAITSYVELTLTLDTAEDHTLVLIAAGFEAFSVEGSIGGWVAVDGVEVMPRYLAQNSTLDVWNAFNVIGNSSSAGLTPTRGAGGAAAFAGDLIPYILPTAGAHTITLRNGTVSTSPGHQVRNRRLMAIALGGFEAV